MIPGLPSRPPLPDRRTVLRNGPALPLAALPGPAGAQTTDAAAQSLRAALAARAGRCL